jgi:hypothetical protein
MQYTYILLYVLYILHSLNKKNTNIVKFTTRSKMRLLRSKHQLGLNHIAQILPSWLGTGMELEFRAQGCHPILQFPLPLRLLLQLAAILHRVHQAYPSLYLPPLSNGIVWLDYY